MAHSSASHTASQSSVSPTSITVNSVPKTNPLFHSFNQENSVKLDRGNYLLWESVFLQIIEGNKLEHHLDRKTKPPLHLIPDDVGMKSNPDFEEWQATDRLLVGWVRNTMSVQIGAQLLHCRSARDKCTEQWSLTGASTKGRVMVYKYDLYLTRKDEMNIKDFLTKMKTIVDNLTLAGALLPSDDFIMHTLNGLDAEYNAIVVKLLDQPQLSWVELQANLLALESHLEQLNQFTNLSIEPSANTAQHGSSSCSNSSSWHDSKSSGPWRGSHRSCGLPRGHSCSSRGCGHGRPFCIYCKHHGHDISKFFYLNDDDNQVNYASAGSVVDPAWYMDSGANCHVAPSTESLDHASATSTCFLRTCNGEKTPIHTIGSIKLASNILLSKVLVAPSFTKKLLSISQLVQDNSVIVEFNDIGCSMKD
ncbi:hypothetical protein QN277_009269 [Acacia crassicarpa]|uniref:Retrovirus-related Pol polyprotein from transposon TNT 1-94-like beta-barrel domain-containing protein n=1 Tax=Acacia crassicarpa TaxID=499986 RepID=A0AAE1ITG7_9FABA|nr:hypothetical protein QN277_009269 [Acacia crassicarpa]